jgi:hypothetical protein
MRVGMSNRVGVRSVIDLVLMTNRGVVVEHEAVSVLSM